MHRTLFLLVTAIGEGLAGLALLLWPAPLLGLLLGVQAPVRIPCSSPASPEPRSRQSAL